MYVKVYITKSFDGAKQEVGEWLELFKSHGILLKIKKIQVLPVVCRDNSCPSSEEAGFVPILIGEIADTKADERPVFSYDEYFRIEEILFTGKYRWKNSESAGVYNEKEIDKLSQAMTVAMLKEWADHMRIDHIDVEWGLKCNK